MTVHGGVWYERDGYERCRYCGSLSNEEAIRRLSTPGCRFSGTDKGFYKFYLTSETGDHGKWYGEHLDDADDDQLARFAALALPVLGWDVFRKDGKIVARCPKVESFYGWQVWGQIGPDGKPVWDEHSATPPDDAWWARVRAARTP